MTQLQNQVKASYRYWINACREAEISSIFDFESEEWLFAKINEEQKFSKIFPEREYVFKGVPKNITSSWLLKYSGCLMSAQNIAKALDLKNASALQQFLKAYEKAGKSGLVRDEKTLKKWQLAAREIFDLMRRYKMAKDYETMSNQWITKVSRYELMALHRQEGGYLISPPFDSYSHAPFIETKGCRSGIVEWISKYYTDRNASSKNFRIQMNDIQLDKSINRIQMTILNLLSVYGLDFFTTNSPSNTDINTLRIRFDYQNELKKQSEEILKQITRAFNNYSEIRRTINELMNIIARMIIILNSPELNIEHRNQRNFNSSEIWNRYTALEISFKEENKNLKERLERIVNRYGGFSIAEIENLIQKYEKKILLIKYFDFRLNFHLLMGTIMVLASNHKILPSKDDFKKEVLQFFIRLLDAHNFLIKEDKIYIKSDIKSSEIRIGMQIIGMRYAYCKKPHTLAAIKDQTPYRNLPSFTPFVSYLRFHLGEVMFTGVLLRLLLNLKKIKAQVNISKIKNQLKNIKTNTLNEVIKQIAPHEKKYIQVSESHTWQQIGLLEKFSESTTHRRISPQQEIGRKAVTTALKLIQTHHLIPTICLCLEYTSIQKLVNLNILKLKNPAPPLVKAHSFMREYLYLKNNTCGKNLTPIILKKKPLKHKFSFQKRVNRKSLIENQRIIKAFYYQKEKVEYTRLSLQYLLHERKAIILQNFSTKYLQTILFKFNKIIQVACRKKWLSPPIQQWVNSLNITDLSQKQDLLNFCYYYALIQYLYRTKRQLKKIIAPPTQYTTMRMKGILKQKEIDFFTQNN